MLGKLRARELAITLLDHAQGICGEMGLWTVGLTDRPAERRLRHRYPSGWLCLPSHSEEAARAMRAYLVRLGMEGVEGDGSHVYIF